MRRRIRSHAPRFGAFAVLALIAGCDSGAQFRRIPETAPAIDARVPNSLPALQSVWDIGRLDQPAEEVFGQIEDLAVDSAGRLYVLDSHYNEVRVFDSAGNFVTAAGGAGSGPGELSAPSAIAVDGDAVWITDRRLLRVTRYAWHGDSLRHANSFRIETTPVDLCASNGSLIMQTGWQPLYAGTILRMDSLGTVEASFGEPYVSENVSVRSMFSEGWISCGPQIAYVPGVLPHVELFDKHGVALTKFGIPGYRPLRMLERSPTSASYDFFPADTANVAITVLWLDNKLLFQLTVVDSSSESMWDYKSLLTFVYDAQQQTLSKPIASWPVIRAASEGIYYGIQQLPFPHVTAYREATP